MRAHQPTWKLTASLIFGLIAMGAGWGISYGKLAGKDEVDAVRKDVAALQNKSERADWIQNRTLELLEELKKDIKTTNAKIDQLNADQITTLREVIKTREAAGGGPSLTTPGPNPLNLPR